MLRALLCAIAIGLVAAPAALAGSGGAWTPVTPEFNQNFNLVGLHRSADGVLHVAAQAHNAANSQHGDFVHIPVAPDGTVGAQSTIAADWVTTNSPAILANPGGGLLAIWGGIHSLNSGDPLNNGSFATSDDSGGAWTLDPAGPWGSGGTAGGTYVYGAQISAENAADGTPFESWSSSTGVWVKRGLDPNTTAVEYDGQLGGETGAVPDFGLDAGRGALYLGWQNSLGSTGLGVYAQQVDSATGAPVGSPALMPGSVSSYQGSPQSKTILGRTPITGRPGRAGVWMAYPSGYPTATKLLVWKVGDSSSTTLANGAADIRHVAIAADPDGRVIVVWGADSGGAGKLFARVSNTDVTAWGPAFEIPPPKGATESWALAASAQSGALVDVVSNFVGADHTTMRFWHTQAVAPPVLAKAVDASVVSGVVLIKLPGSSGFVPLSHASQIPVGAVVDATGGRVRILAALPGDGTQSADFFQGVFQVAQTRDGLATMALVGGNFKVCGKAKRAASTAKVVEIRKLWGAGKGKFRTKGRYAAASIRGTTWLTDDRCDATLIKVTKGSVTVRDFVAKKTVVVSAGHQYLARP